VGDSAASSAHAGVFISTLVVGRLPSSVSTPRSGCWPGVPGRPAPKSRYTIRRPSAGHDAGTQLPVASRSAGRHRRRGVETALGPRQVLAVEHDVLAIRRPPRGAGRHQVVEPFEDVPRHGMDPGTGGAAQAGRVGIRDGDQGAGRGPPDGGHP
jgi:hypothetical protein